ncbi:MAG: hypothetical protein ACYC91_03980 [Solirubrobacteraceae bacterium]
MRPHLARHIRTNAIAYLALFVALGGTGYAAANLPANSVGAKQISNHSIDPVKLDPNFTGAVVRYWATVADGHVIASEPRARVLSWDEAAAAGELTWGGRNIDRGCFAIASSAVRANIPSPQSVQFVVLDALGKPDGSLPVSLALLCPS